MCLFFYNYFGDYMKVYLDLIMILNFGLDFILLLTVSLILKRGVSISRIMLGAFIGGLSIIFLFFKMDSITTFKIYINKLILFIYE